MSTKLHLLGQAKLYRSSSTDKCIVYLDPNNLEGDETILFSLDGEQFSRLTDVYIVGQFNQKPVPERTFCVNATHASSGDRVRWTHHDDDTIEFLDDIYVLSQQAPPSVHLSTSFRMAGAR